MELDPDLLLVGLSHQTTPVALRERYAVAADDAPSILQELASLGGSGAAALISTCNRTEAIVLAPPGEDVEAQVRRTLFRNLDNEHLYTHRGVHAVIHLFRVAAGLDSLVVGESEVLGQVKRSLDQARTTGTLGQHLEPLLTQAIAAGKRVRSETDLGQGTLSVARVAVGVAHHAFGSFENVRALIIGAGETGLLAARHLISEGAQRVDFANRTLSRARTAAEETGGQAFGMGQLAEALLDADLVVTCLEDAAGLLDEQPFDRRALRRRDRPTLVLDLSVPRAVQESVREMEGVLLYDLDDLKPVVEKNRRQRGDARAGADAILVAEVHKFLALRTYASFSPAIADLRRGFDKVRERVLDQVADGRASAREIEVAHELAKQLLSLSLSQMKEGARASRSEAALDRLYQSHLPQQDGDEG
jgi:glutamyl-tRNA reductase